IATGRLTKPRFVRAKQRDDSDDPQSETFDVDPATNTPRMIGMETIPLTLVLPKAPPKSSAGYPLVLLGHGLGASRHAGLTFAKPLTEAGYAIAAIDMDGHGSRFNDQDQTNNTAGVIKE